MNIDFTAPIRDRTGTPMENSDGVLTLKTVAISALDAKLPGDETLSYEDKMRMYELSGQMFSNQYVEVSSRDIARIMARVAAIFPHLIVGRTHDLLTGAAE